MSPTQYAAPPPPPLPENEARNWSMAAHLAPILLAPISAGLAPVLAPLVIWLVFRHRSPLVDDQAKESLNFQITLTIAYVVGLITLVLLVGAVIMLAAWVLSIVFGILGAIAASRGDLYRYPLSIRFVR
ncbi:DUF4870 domain-containing protein [Xylanimonas ulmi]|nr:DUF4870 domain-containing protein [Xylanibacterium ulmi]